MKEADGGIASTDEDSKLIIIIVGVTVHSCWEDAGRRRRTPVVSLPVTPVARWRSFWQTNPDRQKVTATGAVANRARKATHRTTICDNRMCHALSLVHVVRPERSGKS